MIERNQIGTAPRLLEPVPADAAPATHGGTLPWHVSPRSIADTGLDVSLLLGLLLKAAYLHRSVTLAALTDTLKLPATVVNETAGFAVRERLLEVAHRGASEIDVRFRLTDAGHARAADHAARCRYAGAAPVTLDAYVNAVQHHSIRHASASKADVAAAMGDIVIPGGLLDAIGIAMNTGRALMLHGPAGSGKTYIAQRISALLPGAVPVPHAITVAGEIIQIFDPLVHVPLEEGSISPSRRVFDRRWTLCHRPLVLTGGELTLAMLDLRYDESSGFYQAPPHVKANNGVYVIDDLGRQLVGVRDLLNRWIVPLDRGIDMFTLGSGVRFSLPFDVWPVFSSNIDPRTLNDDAFLRRLGSKQYVGPLSVDEYHEVFMRAAHAAGLRASEDCFDYLLKTLHFCSGTPLLACIPGDLVRLMASAIHYHGGAPQITESGLRTAWHSYFGSAADEAGAPDERPGDPWVAHNQGTR